MRAHDFDSIPPELRDAAQWVCWQSLERDGRLTKVPFTVDGERADVTNPNDWTTFESALITAQPAGDTGGIGWVLSDNDPIAFIDLDHCVDPATGVIADWAQEIVATLNSYTERSPGGDGLHVFVRADPPGPRHRCQIDAPQVSPRGRPGLEIYQTARYATVTGDHLTESPTTITEATSALHQIYARYFPEPTPAAAALRPTVSVSPSDTELLARARSARNGAAFAALWEGDVSGYGGDHSAADLALCAHLAFWTGHDASRMDRLFRQSDLMRPKWDERRGAQTYGQRTIEVACAQGTDVDAPAITPAQADAAPTPRLQNIEASGPSHPFPISAIPTPLRTMIEEGAAAYGVPPEFLAVPLLAMAGGAMGCSFRIQMKPGFEEFPILWAAVVAPPGTGKTPAFAAARRPIDLLQADARDRHQDALAEYEADLAEWQSAPKDERGDKPDKPRMETIFTTDATQEALAAALEDSPGMVLVRDELVGWVKAFDAYRSGRGGDRQSWLSSWSGQPFKVDRKSADPIYVTDPVICVAGSVQPAMLGQLAEEAGRQDGFLERILYSFPAARPAPWTEATIHARTQAAVASIFLRLRPPSPAATPVQLSAAAKVSWVAWYNGNAALIEAAPGLLAGVTSKLPVQLARLTLILHCWTYPDTPTAQPVSPATMADAIELVEYFRAHAQRVMAELGIAALTPDGGLAARCERVLHTAGDWIDGTELSARLGGHVHAREYERAIDVLVSQGRAETRSEAARGRRGGRPRQLYRATPAKKPEKPEIAAPDGLSPVNPVDPQELPDACRACSAEAEAYLPDSTPVCARHNGRLVQEAVAVGGRVLSQEDLRALRRPSDADLLRGPTTGNVSQPQGEEGGLL